MEKNDFPNSNSTLRLKEKMFDKESDLVEEFILATSQKTPFLIRKIAKEFYYLSGRIDLIARNKSKRLYSFEAKLKQWKIAVHQAFKNTSLSHFSYVLLPYNVANSVVKFKSDFIEKRIGLATIEDGRIKILIAAPYNNPIQPWLTESAFLYLDMECHATSESFSGSSR